MQRPLGPCLDGFDTDPMVLMLARFHRANTTAQQHHLQNCRKWNHQPDISRDLRLETEAVRDLLVLALMLALALGLAPALAPALSPVLPQMPAQRYLRMHVDTRDSSPASD